MTHLGTYQATYIPQTSV